MDSPTLKKAQDNLISKGIAESRIASGEVRVHSLLYMIYWFHRFEKDDEEKEKMLNCIQKYLQESSFDLTSIQEKLDEKIIHLANHYVKQEIQAVQTVDLIIERTRQDSNEKEVLLFERTPFPQGVSLPGGLVEESDEHNELGIDAKTFTALRVACQKVLHLDFKKEALFKKSWNEQGQLFYSVENKSGTQKILIHPYDVYGYRIKENLNTVFRPSDPRHLVDTVGFKCEIIDETQDAYQEYFWESKSDILKNTRQHSSLPFAFHHHQEMIFHMLARTSLEVEMNFNETNFVKQIIKNPLDSYQVFQKRFQENHLKTDTSFPELFPTVHHVLKALFSERINTLCSQNELYIGFRDKVVNQLRHVSLKNRTFCPYLPTISAIFDGIAFLDVVARAQKNFYQNLPKDQIIEHNPQEKEHASYHMYKYRYRMDELLSKIPVEIIIPTFSNISATDLLTVRGVPIRFVGLSTDFIYVDEFEQSPEEFLMHDINHSYRMMSEDEKYISQHPLSQETFLKQQTDFISFYLKQIKITNQDSQHVKEFKKIKKMILFEITHEEAKPFLPDVILASILKKEGGQTPFEMPVLDEKTHYLDIVDVLDTEINTLSYVRNKLQCGFYDKIDNQNISIVSPHYRKASWIAEAAMEMVIELSQLLGKKVEVNQDYLLQRACSVGPDNLYKPVQMDESLDNPEHKKAYLNPKRYISNQKSKF